MQVDPYWPKIREIRNNIVVQSLFRTCYGDTALLLEPCSVPSNLQSVIPNWFIDGSWAGGSAYGTSIVREMGGSRTGKGHTCDGGRIILGLSSGVTIIEGISIMAT
jgi:hypothetical protein